MYSMDCDMVLSHRSDIFIGNGHNYVFFFIIIIWNTLPADAAEASKCVQCLNKIAKCIKILNTFSLHQGGRNNTNHWLKVSYPDIWNYPNYSPDNVFLTSITSCQWTLCFDVWVFHLFLTAVSVLIAVFGLCEEKCKCKKKSKKKKNRFV